MMIQNRNVPTLRFAEFSGNWEAKKLEDITFWSSGGTPFKDNDSYWNGDIPWISASSMRGTKYSDSKLKITDEGLKNGSKLAKKGALLILVRGSMLFNTIPIGIVTRDVAFNQDVKSINCNDETTSEFILYWFISSENRVLNMVSGTGIGAGKLDLTELKKMLIHLPTLPEQQKIAAFLTAVDEKIQQLTKKKDLLEQYKKGLMRKIFNQEIRFKDSEGNDFADWEEKSLGEVCKIYDGTHMTPDYKESGIPFYSVEHITADNFNQTKFIAEEVYEKENKRVKLEKGDILMTRIGDIGTSKYISWDVRASFYVSLALIKQSKSINSLYLNQYIATNDFQKELWKRTIHVAFPKKINLGEIGNCLVKIPVEAEQTKIANFLSALDDKINLINQQLEKMKEYKKGLLQQMFV